MTVPFLASKTAEVICPHCRTLYRALVDKTWWVKASMHGRRYPPLPCLKCQPLQDPPNGKRPVPKEDQNGEKEPA